MIEGHTHRWRIEEPNGPTSRGECACGAARMFGNSEETVEGPMPLHLKGSYRQHAIRVQESMARSIKAGRKEWQCQVCGKHMFALSKGTHRLWHERQARGEAS